MRVWLSGILAALLVAVSAGGQSISSKNAIEGHGLTGYAVRSVPDDFQATEREWLKLLAEDPAVQEAMRNALVYEINERIETKKKFDNTISWQNWIGRVIFLVVHVSFGMGLYFASREFRAADATRKQSGKAGEPPQHEVEVGLQKLALKSSLHGLALLSIAFAFYLAFLVFVYPIAVL